MIASKFAIAVQWPDEPKLYLVHLHRPYFVAAAARCSGAEAWFCANLSSRQLPALDEQRAALFREASAFFADALGVSIRQAHFVKGRHGHEFPRFLMARTTEGKTFIVEPDYPAPLVEVKEPDRQPGLATKLSPRFDVVTQWRLNEMRRYYRQFLDRQRTGGDLTGAIAKLGA